MIKIGDLVRPVRSRDWEPFWDTEYAVGTVTKGPDILTCFRVAWLDAKPRPSVWAAENLELVEPDTVAYLLLGGL